MLHPGTEGPRGDVPAKEYAAKLADQNANTACDARPQRTRLWHECGLEEKVDRLRGELMQSREAALYAAGTANRAESLSRRHQHSVHGEVLISADERSNSGIAAGRRSFDPLA